MSQEDKSPVLDGRGWLWAIAVAVIYYVSARLGLALAMGPSNASPVWPPSGIALAAVLLLGYRVWPGIFVGALAAEAGVFAEHEGAGLASVLGVSAAIAVGNTLEAVVGAYLVRRLTGFTAPFSRVKDVFRFTGVALVVCLMSSVLGPFSLTAGGFSPWRQLHTVWFTWWVGDVTAVLLITPLLVSWVRGESWEWSAGRTLEAAVLLLLILISGFVLFMEAVPIGFLRAKPYVATPMLLWVIFRFRLRETTTGLVLVCGFAVWGALLGVGPFAARSLNESLLALQIFIAAISVTGVALSAALTERRRSLADLQALNEALEQRVAARTIELEASNTGLRHEIVERKRAEIEREKVIAELTAALAQVRTLSGLLPICASCKNVRDDEGYWKQIEKYVEEHSEAQFSHSICPDCFKRLYPGLPQERD